MTIVVLRHADAGDRFAWRGDDRLRPLTAKGQWQAEVLALQLAEQDSPLRRPGQPAIEQRHTAPTSPVRVISSPYLRCVETVAPVAEALQVEVETDDRAAEGNSGAWIIDLLTTATPTVVCSHGDVIGDVLRQLAAAGSDLGPSPRLQKAGHWTLEYHEDPPQGSGAIRATYAPPPRREMSPS